MKSLTLLIISRIALILFIFLIIPSNCQKSKEKIYDTYHKQVESVGDLTDENIKKYIKTYAILKKSGQNYFKLLSDNREGIKGSKDIFNKIESDIKKGGFSSYAEFVKLNAKIAWAWSISQAYIGLDKQKKLQKWGQGELQKGKDEIKKALNDPDVPEETKISLRKTYDELDKSGIKLKNEYEKNMIWAQIVMKQVTPLTNKKDIEVILRNQSGLMQVFTGLSTEQIKEIEKNSFKELKTIE